MLHLLFFHKTTNKYQNRKNQTTCLRVLFHLHFINLLVNSIIVWITESATQQQISKADMHGITDNESESFVISSSSQVVVLLTNIRLYKEIEKRIQAMTINLWNI